MAVWHGDVDELRRLINVTHENKADQAMLEQRFLDGVLFARYLRATLLGEEGLLGTNPRHQRVPIRPR